MTKSAGMLRLFSSFFYFILSLFSFESPSYNFFFKL